MRFSRVTYNTITLILAGMALFISINLLLGRTLVKEILTVTIILALASCAACAFAKSREPTLKGPVCHVWRLVTSAFFAYTVSYVYMYLAFICRNIHTPYPCLGDLTNVVAAIMLCVALGILAVVMIRSGLPIGRGTRYLALTILLLIIVGAFDSIVLSPILKSQTMTIQKVISAIYTITNSLNIVAALILLTISLNFRGHIMLSWIHTSLGFFFVLAGNIIFAIKHIDTLPPKLVLFNDIIFLIGYVMIFRGIAFMRHSSKHRRITSSF